jgi:Tfp pilus assembly protein PilO
MATFILLLILTELGMFGKQLWIDYQQHLIKDDLAKVEQTRKEIQDKINRINVLKAELSSLEQQKKSLSRIQELYGEKLPKRNEDLHAFIKVFEDAVDDGVVFDKVTENSSRGFTISAWALDEVSAQNFIKRFQVLISPLGYRLKDITVSQQTGRLGMVGNGIVFNATQLDDDKWEESKLLPVTPVTRRR